MPGGNLCPAHSAWQQRVDKERKALNKHIHTTIKRNGGILPGEDGTHAPYDVDNVAPLHDLHRSASLPAIAELDGLPVLGSGSRLATSMSRPGTHSTASAVTRSRKSLSFARKGDLAPGTPSNSGSRLTSLSGVTTASLRREIDNAVQQEVAKVVQPLKERLQSEQNTRQRLEDMLRRAKGEEM
mmetsp:Transcript_36378/g.100198  ORF Transcript_36378/g.100198 Transcript_36378/m.100198 type:complete len:184 (-) Transcript_36378:97-648(-)